MSTTPHARLAVAAAARATRLAVVFALAQPALFAASPAAAQPGYGPAGGENALRLRLGLFTPRGDGEYWRDKERDFTGEASNFEEGIAGVEYARRLAPLLDLLVSAGSFVGEETQRYRDFVDHRGAPIAHATRVETTHLLAGVRFRFAPQRAPIVPYAAIGGGLYTYTLEERGDFVDFNPPPATIFSDVFQTEGETFGWYVAAGLEANLGRQFGLFAEARWHDAEDDLDGDFDGFGSLDLAGREISGGFLWRF